jgi:hypothetical protein
MVLSGRTCDDETHRGRGVVACDGIGQDIQCLFRCFLHRYFLLCGNDFPISLMENVSWTQAFALVSNSMCGLDLAGLMGDYQRVARANLQSIVAADKLQNPHTTGALHREQILPLVGGQAVAVAGAFESD